MATKIIFCVSSVTNLIMIRDMEHDVKSLVIGLDLGGTNSVFGIVDRRGGGLGHHIYQDSGFPGG